ncbi:exonuclease [Ramaria rubella]|nr:exonuclease [Ramaria rubella]
MLSTRVGLRTCIPTKVQRCPYRLPSNAIALVRTEATLASEAAPSPSLLESERNPSETSPKAEGIFFVDSVFPIRLGTWDLRHYIAFFQKEPLVERLEDLLRRVGIRDFEVQSVTPRIKDGGVFVNFRYTPTSELGASYQISDSTSSLDNPALVEIEHTLTESINAYGGLPSWIGMRNGRLWRVRGKPWREDMRRYASPILRVSFEGPDVSDERIWETLRPYGRILDVKSPGSFPAGTLRFVTVTFERMAYATIAHNCIYGAYVSPSSKDPKTLTRLITAYERPLKPHLIREWLASHPRIVFPVLVFLLGTLTYTVFDPIRAIAVQAKVMGWLDYRKFAVTRWLRRNALDRLIMSSSGARGESQGPIDTSVWKDRQEAESALDSYLSDYPSTITFLHGPAGSGKSQLLRSVLEQSDRRTVVVDCIDIFSGGSDSAMVSSLAEQTGYWPVFSFLNSVNNLIDLASTGLIGQKAGLSSSLQDQVTQVLDVVAHGLRRVSSSRRKEAGRNITRAQNEEKLFLAGVQRRERIRRGVWHDGRVDCVAGNGVMSELGVGIERFGEDDEDTEFQGKDEDTVIPTKPELNEKMRREREYRSAQDVGVLPVVVIKNFNSNAKPGKEEIVNALAEWAADLVADHIAHVIVVSDNRENAKRLAKALPTKPLNAIALADADSASSLSYINKKLEEASVDYNISHEEAQLIERLGGRASDLETIIHKVRAGQDVADAVEDIIQRGVVELRKNAFGDDTEDAKGLLWTRQQAWTVLKLLAQKDKLQYYQVLLDFPFKGDESALRAMEHAELISITTVEGRPATIRPGKPIHRYVFQRLLTDRVFRATQDIAYNELLISGAQSVIQSAESELVMLKDIVSGSWSIGSGVRRANNRALYLTDKMQDALQKMKKLERENAGLKKVLSEISQDEEKDKRKSWTLW